MSDTVREFWMYDVQDYLNLLFLTEEEVAKAADQYPDAIFFVAMIHTDSNSW